jgi:putative hydrolase of the HAD superfamily
MTASLKGRPVTAVLFDYGGTLAFFRRPDAALLTAYESISSRLLADGHAAPTARELLRDVHDRVEAEFLRHRQSGSLEEIDLVAAARRAYAAAGFTLSDDVLDDVLRIEQEAWWAGVQANPDAVATLDALRSAGVKVGVCSNAPYRARSLHEQLAHVGLRDHLDSATFSAEVGWCKPDARMFIAALRSLRADASEAVMVGDSEHDDIAGAHGAGMRAVLYRPPEAYSREVPDSAADFVIQRLSELPGLLGLVPAAYTGRRD